MQMEYLQMFLIKVDEQGYIHSKFQVDEDDDFSLVQDDNMDLTYLRNVFSYKDKKLVSIFFPIGFKEELYWSTVKGFLMISNSFLALAKESQCTARYVGASNKLDFIKKGSMPTGETILEEIKRFFPNQRLRFEKGNLVSKSPKCRAIGVDEGNMKGSYEEFKTRLDTAIANQASKHNIVLFSGGADSLLISLVLQKLELSQVLYTFRPEPLHQIGAGDLDRATRIADYLGIEHKVISSNINDYELPILRQYVRIMPTASHLCIPFDNLFEAVDKGKESMVFCGQNADNLYNFGFTHPFALNRQGLIDILGRFLLSDLYLNNVFLRHPRPFKKLLANASGALIAFLYSLQKRESYRQPKSLDEVLEGVKRSPEGLIFLPRQQVSISEEIHEPGELFRQLLDYKVHNYTRSGASSVVYAASKLHDVSCALPYSSDEVIPFYYKVRRDLRSVIHPKYFIYKYIKELFPGYDMLTRCNKGPSHKALLSYAEWCERLIRDTGFGRGLMGALGKSHNSYFEDLRNYPTKSQLLSAYLSEFWLVSLQQDLLFKQGDLNECLA